MHATICASVCVYAILPYGLASIAIISHAHDTSLHMVVAGNQSLAHVGKCIYTYVNIGKYLCIHSYICIMHMEN